LIHDIADLLDRIDGAIAVVEQLDRELRERPRVTAQLSSLLEGRLPRLGFDAVSLG
jgi:hypothetical protein